MKVQLISVAFLIFIPTMSVAFEGGGGDGGCCGITQDRIDGARSLVDQVSDSAEKDLELRLALGEICSHFDCGTLDEDKARRVIQASLSANASWWDRMQKIGLAFVAFSGLFLGLMNRYRPRS